MNPLYWIFIAALIFFAIYRRVRRNIGWQLLRTKRMKVRIVIFLVIGALFLTGGAAHPVSLISDAAGILVGTVLAFYSSKITRFEQRDEHLYYMPNVWIGAAVSLLFIGRLLFRMFSLYSDGALQGTSSDSAQSMSQAMGNSWTAGLLLIMFAYYTLYYFILLSNHKKLDNSVEHTD